MEHQDWKPVIISRPPPINTNKKYLRIKKDPCDSDDPPPPESIPLSTRSNFQKARISKGLSQAKLAMALNLNPKVISNLENGTDIPSKSLRQKIARYLNIKI